MFDESALLGKLGKARAKRILVQIPEGLKTRAFGISKILEKNGLEAIVSVEPCFGACDLRDKEAKELGCDAVIHIGHSDLGSKTSVPVIYDECRIDFDPVTLLKSHLRELGNFSKIGLVSTIQYTAHYVVNSATCRFFGVADMSLQGRVNH